MCNAPQMREKYKHPHHFQLSFMSTASKSHTMSSVIFKSDCTPQSLPSSKEPKDNGSKSSPALFHDCQQCQGMIIRTLGKQHCQAAIFTHTHTKHETSRTTTGLNAYASHTSFITTLCRSSSWLANGRQAAPALAFLPMPKTRVSSIPHLISIHMTGIQQPWQTAPALAFLPMPNTCVSTIPHLIYLHSHYWHLASSKQQNAPALASLPSPASIGSTAAAAAG